MNNDYSSAEEQARLACMSVKTEIMANKASNGTYTATGDASNLRDKVASDLKGTGWGTPTVENNAIKVTYTNTSLKAGGIGTNKPKHDGYVDFEIRLSENDATLYVDGVETNGTTPNNQGSGGGSGTGGTGSTVTIIAARGTPEVPENSATLANNYVDTMKGAYVKYGAGVWGPGSDAIMKQLGKNGAKYENYSGTVAPNQQGQFGGFQQDTWAATGASSSDENGQFYVGTTPAWQILGKDSSGCIQLMSTYITEEYYHAYGQSSASESLLTGNGDRSFSIYENTLLAVAGSAHAMTKTEVDSLPNNNLRKATTLPGMANSTNSYWLGTSNTSSSMSYFPGGSSLGHYYNNCYGVRPVVSLKSDILYSGSGTVEDPYVVGYSN